MVKLFEREENPVKCGARLDALCAAFSYLLCRRRTMHPIGMIVELIADFPCGVRGLPNAIGDPIKCGHIDWLCRPCGSDAC